MSKVEGKLSWFQSIFHSEIIVKLFYYWLHAGRGMIRLVKNISRDQQRAFGYNLCSFIQA